MAWLAHCKPATRGGDDIARRVALGFAQRMAAPAVTLMFNGSSYHSLPALLSDLHEALAGVANGTDPKAGAAAGQTRPNSEQQLTPCLQPGHPDVSSDQ